MEFNLKKLNPFVIITAIALVIQSYMLVLFYSLPDPLGLSLSEMFSGRTIWQICMAFGAVLVMSSIFTFLKKPRAMVIFYVFYFFIAIADYEVFRFSHQRLSYSFIRTYFHLSNIVDETTITTLGGDLKGTILWVGLLLLIVLGGTAYCIYETLKRKKSKKQGTLVEYSFTKKLPISFLTSGLILSIIPLILFLTGARGEYTIPVINTKVDIRFTLGKHTLTAPILHIAAVETFEFVRDNYSITDELIDNLDSFLPADFSKSRQDAEFPGYRKTPAHAYKAQHPYNIVFIFGESFKGRIINQMLEGDTTLAPSLWDLANRGSFWFKNAFSGGYPTVRGTMATYLGFPSHPNRDLPSFYASNHFTGFPELLENYTRYYVTVSNPVFDHTLPFVEKFFGDNWRLPEDTKIPGTTDSLGVDKAIEVLDSLPTDSHWLLTFNTIATHIPFFGYPDEFAPKPDDAMERYRNALRYTDQQLGRFFEKLATREDYENTVVIILGDHDTPVDSIDYAVPQPLGVATTRIFMGIFSADTNLVQGLNVREDVASQHDVGPTIMDLAQVRKPNHYWGYDLLAQERPANQPSMFFSQNSYYLGFRDHVIMGGLDNEEVYRGEKEHFAQTTDKNDLAWKTKAVGASKVLRSLLRNDTMQPKE